jgi:hypothetical protein
MKKNILLFLLTVIFSAKHFAQVTVDSTIKLDLLQSPASPAFNILGIALNDVERPTDLSSFALSIQQATNNFTTMPNSYAFQVAPFLLTKRKYTLNEFDNGANAFKQSFLISAGFTHIGPKGKEDIDSLKTTKIGFGIKFSIVRPGWSNTTRSAYNNLIRAQQQLLDDARIYEQNHPKKALLEKKKLRLKILEDKDTLTPNETTERQKLLEDIAVLDGEIFEGFTDELPSTANYENAKKAALAFKTERRGFFLDFSGGAALDFPDNRFSNSKVYRAGMWFTGGHENGNSGFSFLGIARYLYNPKTIFADPGGLVKGSNVSTVDMGGRILLDGKEKFLFSAEAIYRSILGNSLVKPSWRLVLNAEYDISMNRKLTFAFGRDFDGTISKGGNLIAAINLIAGFGTDRKISPKN